MRQVDNHLNYIELVRTGEFPDFSELGSAEEIKGARAKVQYRDPELQEAFSRYANLAFDYFAKALERKLHELPQQLFMEVMTAITIKMSDDGFIPLKGKSAATKSWKDFLDGLSARIKSQWDAPKPGPKPEWTPEQRAVVLDHYNEKLKLLQSVLNEYEKTNSPQNWREEMIEQHPELDERLQDAKLIDRLIDERPSNLALELTGKHFDLIRERDRAGEDYLRRQLSMARDEQGIKRKRRKKNS